MPTPVAVSSFETKSHDTPDETRAPAKTRIEVVKLEGYTIGRLNFEPGWRWSECIKPVVGTESCQTEHIGYLVSGKMGIKTADGTTAEVMPGSVYHIEPGHDGWVVGDQPVVVIEFQGASTYAKTPA